MYAKRSKFDNLLSLIAQLFTLGKITSDEKNKMTKLVFEGYTSNNFSKLYSFCAAQGSNKYDKIIEELIKN